MSPSVAIMMAFIGAGYVPCLLMFNFHGDSVRATAEAKGKAYDGPKSHTALLGPGAASPDARLA